MTDLDKAREWAESVSAGPATDRAHAAAEVIQSLPDQWVDVEEVREVISSQLSNYTRGTVGHYIAEEITSQLKSLIPPKLPTLADMTQREREACQWMQARYSGSDCDHVIVLIWPERAVLLRKDDGLTFDDDLTEITPLPDLPKLQWPGDGVVDAEIVEDPETTGSGSIHTPMQPSEVPPNEPWLIEVDGEKAIGARYRGDAVVPWSVAALDGSFAGDYNDREITLIHKLVPETHALPEGMRLADHEEYGRVVVAPRANTHGEEYFYRLIEDSPWGASHGYRPTGEFNFLGGEA